VRSSCAARSAAILVLSLLGCAKAALYGHATFPAEGEPHWKIPLLTPLERRSAYVLAELEGAPDADGKPRRRTISVLVDTGARTNIPPRVIQDLGLEVVKSKRRKGGDAHGFTAFLEESAVPQIRLGDLVLTDVPVLATSTIALVGADILFRYPIEIDFDRGMLTIGAGAWPRTASIAAVPIEARYTGQSTIHLSLDGTEVLFFLDSGADTTSIDFKAADALGIVRKKLDKKMIRRGLYSEINIAEVYPIERVQAGGHDFGPAELVPLPKFRRGGALNEKVIGLLGMDLLGCARFRIDYDQHLVELAPRGLAQAHLRERVSRWPWAAPCGDGGCLAVSLEPKDGAVALQVRELRAIPVPASYTFSCASAGGAVDPRLPFVSVNLGPLAEGQSLGLTTTNRNRPPVGRLLDALANPERCPSLTLVDVNPIQEGAPIGRTWIHDPPARACPPAGRGLDNELGLATESGGGAKDPPRRAAALGSWLR
jgi:predicted aspartyl protease